MSGQRVLVVDDEPQILRALTTNLRGAGYEVDTASTGEAALAAAAMRPPDAVILDLVLPDRSGTEVCRELRTWSSAPVLVLSVVGDEPEKVPVLAASATLPPAPTAKAAAMTFTVRILASGDFIICSLRESATDER